MKPDESMVRAGFESFERGKHCEVTCYTGGWNKGERDGVGTSGVKEGKHRADRVESFVKQEEIAHTVFVDNLPKSILKGEIFKEFWHCGVVKDLYISRKWRQSRRRPFAFVRFATRKEADGAVKEMNGRVWNGKRMHVKISRFRRGRERYMGRVMVKDMRLGERSSSQYPNGRNQASRNVRWGKGKAVNTKQRWVPTGRLVGTGGMEAQITKTTIEGDKGGEEKRRRRKEVEVLGVLEKKEMLKRSLMGVNGDTIEFEMTKKAVLENWKGPGVIECRDIKEEAVKDDAWSSVFDEIRLHWDHFSGLSRRVWVEVMGLPVYVWSEKTFRSIAELWGKYIYADNRTEEYKSFTVARFLIDSFEWEMINEWILIKVEGRQFEVFAKEFGAKVYGRESHPNEDERKLMNVSAISCSGSWVEETPGSMEEPVPKRKDDDVLDSGNEINFASIEKEGGVIMMYMMVLEGLLQL
ncbi:hypothetical protein PIB30_020711 [Stylosanthes scabra]|uniref:RRM domain-containing protein n=1 Tax=Stylosanthes scabra TaxID=79078 RepID=A0ABU6X6S9_9FABA|nr:hypothetical protein [Stylosanthes scabra]